MTCPLSLLVLSQLMLAASPVLSKNTNELEICVPCRFGLEVAGCYVSTIWKPHEYFDLTGSRDQISAQDEVLRTAL